MKRKLIILSVIFGSIIMMISHSAFAITVGVNKSGTIILDKSRDKDKISVSCKKDCSVTVIEKSGELNVTNKDNKVTVTNKGETMNSLVYSQVDGSKDTTIIENGTEINIHEFSLANLA